MRYSPCMPTYRPSPHVRFSNYIVMKPPADGGCWHWVGAVTGTKSKYGYFHPGGDSPMVLAHRWIYQQRYGPIPPGLQVDHTCGQALCVNPEHLEAVTPTENQARRRLKVCRRGLHDLTNPENVNWDRLGRRRGCKLCNGRKPNVRV